MITSLRTYLVYSCLLFLACSAYGMDTKKMDTKENSDFLLYVTIQSDGTVVDSSKDVVLNKTLNRKNSTRAEKKLNNKLESEKETLFGNLFAWMNFNFSSAQETQKKNIIKVKPPKVLGIIKYKEEAPSPFEKKETQLLSKGKKSFFSHIYKLMGKNKIVALDSQQIQAQYEKGALIQCSVAQQSGATCAYHAFKNGLYMAMLPFVAGYNTLLRDNVLFALKSKEEVERLIGFKGHWRKKVQEYIKKENRELGNDGEWLDKEAVEVALMNFEKENKNILFASKITEENITIIDNVENRSTLVYDEIFLKLCQKMRDQKASFVHIFLVGSMQQSSGNSGLGFGHWYTLVVNKVEEETQFFVSDSLGRSRINDDKVQKIIKYLQEGDRSAMVQRLYLNDTVERLLACIRAYVTDEYNAKEEYSRQSRAGRILECKEILNSLLQKYSEDLSQEYIKEVQRCIRIGEQVISVDNSTLLKDLPGHIPDLMQVRATMNKSLYLQTNESDDFDVPFAMWRIAYYAASQEEKTKQEVQKLVEIIKPKIEKTGRDRKECGKKFLELVNNKTMQQEQLEDYKKELLTVVGLYVNM